MKDKIKLIVVLLFIIIIAGFFILKSKTKVETGVKGNSDVKVPNIIGLELLEARSRLKGQNIQIETIDYYPVISAAMKMFLSNATLSIQNLAVNSANIHRKIPEKHPYELNFRL